MFDYKKYLLLVAAASLMAACGGGEGGDQPPATAPDNGEIDEGDTGGDGGEAVADQMLAGRLNVVGNSLLYVRRDRTMYLPITLERFEDAHGMNDVAPGFTGNEEIGDPYRPWDGINYAPPQTLAPAAPIAAFGIRVDKRVQPITASQVVTNQKAVGRVAVELVERSDGPSWLQRGQREIVRYVINNVELSTNEIGELSARVLPGAQMHVYGRNASGTEVRQTVPVREDAVSMLSMEYIPDNYGDRSSEILLFDFEKAFSQAGSSLDSLNNVEGYFDVRVTLSSVEQIVRPARCELTRKELVGQDITVNDQPTVKGAGVNGYAWVRTWDPDPPPDQGYGERPSCSDGDSGSETVNDTPEEPVSEPAPQPEPEPTPETEG